MQRLPAILITLLLTSLALPVGAMTFTVNKISEEGWENTRALSLRFSQAIDEDSRWRNQIEVRQGQRRLDSDRWIYQGKQLVLPFIEPDSDYQITLSSQLTSEQGQRLGRSVTETLTSLALEPFARFASQGSVLSPHLKLGLPVQHLNSSSVDVEIFRLAPEVVPDWQRLLQRDRLYFRQLSELNEAASLVFSGRFQLSGQANETHTSNLDLSDLDAIEPSGLYIATLRQPGEYDSDWDAMVFSISDIGIQLRRQDDKQQVFTHRISTGEPLAGVELELYQYSSSDPIIAQARTDRRGQAILQTGDTQYPRLLIASQGQAQTLLALNAGALDLSRYNNAQRQHQAQQVFAWSERDLFRPGETLESLALLRDYSGHYIANIPLVATLRDATGQVMRESTLIAEESGAYHFTYPLGSTATTGTWRLQYSLPGGDQILTEQVIQVEAFIPERIEVSLFDGQRAVASHATDYLDLPVQADYLYGAPAAGNRVDGRLIAELDHRPFSRWPDYFFGDVDERISPAQVELPSEQLNEQGQHRFSIDVKPWQSIRSPIALVTDISVYESGGRSVSEQGVISQIKPGHYIGIDPLFERAVDNNSQARFQLLATDETGQPVAEQVQIKLIKEERDYYWHESDSRGWVWDYRENNIEVAVHTVSLTANQDNELALPVEVGDYRLEVYVDDQLNNRFRFRTSWGGWYSQSDQMQPDQIQIQWQQSTHQPGEQAQVTLLPPVDGDALLTLESSDGILWQKTVALASEGTQISLPINQRWDRHDLYLTALQIVPGDMQSAVAPKRALGISHLAIRRANSELDLTLTVADEVTPNQSVQAQIELAQAPSQPTWVALAAVDVGVLNITRFESPNPASALYGARRYGWSIYDIYDDIIENAGYDYTQQRYGGGFANAMMAEADFVRAADKPNSQVQILALRHAPVQFDAQGKAVVTLDMPSFNGRVRWQAVAWNEHAVGHAQADMQVADKLVTQLSAPNFLAVGDSSRVDLDLHNLSGQAQALTIAMTINGDEQSQTLNLADQAKTTLSYPLNVTNLTDIELELAVTGQDLAVQRQWQIGVRAPAAQATRQTRQILTPGETWQMDLAFEDWLADSIEAQLTLASEPPVAIIDHFNYLNQQRLAGTERTISQAMAWLMLDPQTFERLQLNDLMTNQGYSQTRRQTVLNQASNRLLTRQLANGGFKSWPGTQREDFWLTVYATDFLVRAQENGIEVNSVALDNALNRLQQYLTGEAVIEQGWSDDEYSYRFSVQAYSARVLAQSGINVLSGLRRLLANTEVAMVQTPLAWQHASHAAQLSGDRHLANQLSGYAQQGERPQDLRIGDYGSTLRDLAWQLAIEPETLSEARQLALFELVQNQGWLSSQERFALLYYGIRLNIGNQQLTARVSSQTDQITINQRAIWRRSLTNLADLQAVSATTETVYLTLTARGQAKQPEPQVNNGFAIRRDYFDIQGRPITGTELATGDLVVVRLTVDSRQDSQEAMVVDLLPAGLILDNPALTDLSGIELDGEAIGDWQRSVHHSQYLDDRFITTLAVDSGDSEFLYYLARAATPGVYQIPAPYVEDIYRPALHGFGQTPGKLTITEQ